MKCVTNFFVAQRK